MNYPKIRLALLYGWEPINPNALEEYRRCLDYEKPEDDAFLDSLEREAGLWLTDNVSSE